MSHIVLVYHIIWRTKYSERTISPSSERELYAYIWGYCENKGCKLYRVGGVEDHIHMLVSIRPDISVSSFVQVLKTQTSKWMKIHTGFPYFRGWGNGYAAFSYSEDDKKTVCAYIANQKSHHKRLSFKEEYETMLNEWGIDPKMDLFLSD